MRFHSNNYFDELNYEEIVGLAQGILDSGLELTYVGKGSFQKSGKVGSLS